MCGKREKLENIVLKLRQVEVLQAVRKIDIAIKTVNSWRSELGAILS